MAPKVTVFVGPGVPNPLKVLILLEELGIEYTTIAKEFGDGPNGVKNPKYLKKINPNGRLPAIIDHTNNNHIVWESAAILLYLSERFDPTGKFTGVSLEERSSVWQWLAFQVSGIGPMHGQYFWFAKYHPVKDIDPSVLERYKNETYRAYGVLEKRLEEEGDWIALNRFTVADMANYPWVNCFDFNDPANPKFPRLQAYHNRIKALPSVKRAYERGSPAH